MFGAGCFWGTQKFFKEKFKNGLISSQVGYSGGSLPVGYRHLSAEFVDLMRLFSAPFLRTSLPEEQWARRGTHVVVCRPSLELIWCICSFV